MRRSTVLFAMILVARSAAEAYAVEFKFAPRDGLECTQFFKSHRIGSIKGVDDVPPAREDVTEGVTQVVFKKAGDGYRMTATVKSGEMRQDGKPMGDPITRHMIGRELVIDIGRDGVATGMKGYEELVTAVMAELPAEAKESMAKILTTANLEDRQLAEWNARVARFVGKQASVGDVWEEQSEFPLPGGAIKFTTVTRFSKIEERDGKQMVTIHFAFGVDAPAAKAMMDRVQSDLANLTKGIEVETAEPSLQGGGERLVDANTMTLERETVVRTIRTPMSMPDTEKATMVRTETREYRQDCR